VRMVLDRAEVAEIEEATTAVMGRSARRAKPFTGFEERETWLDALMVADGDLPPELATTDFLSREFESVVLAHQITDQSGYLRVPRPGRGTALNRATRKKVWAVFDVFRNSCARDNKFDWATLATIAAVLLDSRAARTGERVFDHVVIDEAQDFHAGHWRFLRASVAPGPNDIFLAEDSHQRIYGERHVLSHFGISTRGRASKRLTLNYRTTRENLDYAVQILTGEWFDAEGEPDNVDGYRSLRSGPRPTVLRFNSEEDEFAAVADLIGRWQDSLHDPRIGVLSRTRAMVNRAVNGLADHGIVATKTRNPEEAAHETVSVMSMHGAKGMEFTHVILLGMGKESVPLQHRMINLSEGDRDDAEQRERALLYVAASRARDQVVVTTHTEPSALLPTV
jgi:superfamily I DNA/RNA helicase